MSVVDISEQRKREIAREQFAHLVGIAEQNAKAIAENPEPYLREMEDRYYTMMEAVIEARDILTGSDRLFFSQPEQFRSIGEEAYDRNRRALDRLEAVR